MKKTLLVGNFGARNVGDEIILWTALKEHPESIVMTADGDFSRRFLSINSPLRKGAGGICKNNFPVFIPPFPTGIRSFIKFILNRKSREKILKPLRKNQIEKIVFAGGGLLAIKVKAYFIWGITRLWINIFLPKAEINFTHQGVDQTNCPVRKLIIKHFFRNSNKISVRDEISRDFLSTVGITAENKEDRVESWLKKSNLKTNPQKNIVLINACRENSAKFTDLCTPEVLPQGTAAVFICFDPLDARYVPEGFKGQVIFPETVEDTFKIFQKAKMAIGQRLHFLILANHFCGAKNTFTLGKPYSQKVENFAGKYGIKEK